MNDFKKSTSFGCFVKNLFLDKILKVKEVYWVLLQKNNISA